MDFDTWLRLLNTIANYATAIAIIVLLVRSRRNHG